jgi:hypothetical protein
MKRVYYYTWENRKGGSKLFSSPQIGDKVKHFEGQTTAQRHGDFMDKFNVS